jgi:hypothetical protein
MRVLPIGSWNNSICSSAMPMRRGEDDPVPWQQVSAASAGRVHYSRLLWLTRPGWVGLGYLQPMEPRIVGNLFPALPSHPLQLLIVICSSLNNVSNKQLLQKGEIFYRTGYYIIL